jgi:hypothetical protein
VAKKRRKPNTRPRTSAQARTADAAVNGASGPQGTTTTTDTRAQPASPRPGERPGPGPQRTRSEKKELARRQREDLRRRARRAERIRRLAWIGGIAAVVAASVFLIARPKDTTPPESLPGELTTEAPWPANAEQAAARADAINLPKHSDTLAMHNHVNVQIFVHGDPVTIPVNVGIDTATGDVASLHTHTGDGVVHIESSTVADFTLGQFFDVWGVRFSPSCLGGYCNGPDGRLRVYQGGQEVTGPFRDVPLDDQSVIVVTYGSKDELPDPIPSSFDFSSVQP